MRKSPERARPEPVRRAVQVPLAPEAAFRRFTEALDSWWPLETHSVAGVEAETAVFEGREGGRIYERSRDGRTADWGRVLVWEPPSRVVFSWHPGRAPETAQEVEVRFRAVGDGTVLELEHRDWEVFGDRAEEMRSNYEGGWEFVLGRYAA